MVAARGGRHHVAPAVDHIDMAGVAGDEAMLGDGRFADPGPADLRLQPANQQARRAALGLPGRNSSEARSATSLRLASL